MKVNAFTDWIMQLTLFKGSLKKRLIFLVLTMVLFILVIGIFAYTSSKNTLEKKAFDELTAIREVKGNSIETYFGQIRGQIKTFSEDRMIIEAMKEFKEAFHQINATESELANYEISVREYYQNEYLPRLNKNTDGTATIDKYWVSDPKTIISQYNYISNNPHATGEKDNLNKANDGSQYSEVHEKYHPIIRSYLEQFGYYDIFLVDPDTGHIVYTVFKEIDYTTSLLSGPYKNTNFASTFKKALDTNDKDFIILEDFEAYDPSYYAPASFIASPIYDGNEKVGVLLFQMPIDEINGVMTGNQNWKQDGLGESGETYLVGRDYRMKSISRFLVEDPEGYFSALERIGYNPDTINIIKQIKTSINLQEVRTKGTEAALSDIDNENTDIIDDYRGISVLSSYKPLRIKDVDWVILSEIDEEEAFAPIRKLGRVITIFGLTISILVLLLAFFIARSITKPITELENASKEIEKGNFDIRVDIRSKDELGRLGESFNKTTESLGKLNEEQKRHNEELEREKKETEIKAIKLKKAETATLNILEDVKKSEENLRIYMKGFKTSPNSMALVDYKNNLPHVLNINDAYLKYYGYKKEEILGKKPDLLNSGKQDKKFYEKMWKDILDPKIGFWTGEIINKKKNGELLPVILSIYTIFDKANIPIYFLESHVDITKMKEVDKLKDELISVAGHELKTPLTSINSLTQLILDDEMGKINDEQRESLNLVLKDGNRLFNLIESMLDVSRIEGGRVKYDFTNFDLLELINDSVKTSDAIVKQKGSSIKVQTKGKFPITADKTRVGQVVINLITNAAKYGKDKGTILISVAKKGDKIIFAVKDDGIGISEKNQEHLFEKMFQVDQSAKRKVGGVGFGLYISKRIIEEGHKGKMWIKSILGKGSTFFVSLPIKGIQKVEEVKEKESDKTSDETIKKVENESVKENKIVPIKKEIKVDNKKVLKSVKVQPKVSKVIKKENNIIKKNNLVNNEKNKVINDKSKNVRNEKIEDSSKKYFLKKPLKNTKTKI